MQKPKNPVKKYYSLDIETHDPELHKRGASWQWGLGEILIIGLYDAQKNTNTAYKWDNRFKTYIRKLLNTPDNVIIGANIKYDLLWICVLLDIPIGQIKAETVDIQITEALIDPFAPFALDALSKKYLNQQKASDKLEKIAEQHKLKGDFRKHLKKISELGYNKELTEYVLSDSMQPYYIHLEQMKILTCPVETFELYQKVNIISAQMQQDGVRIDYKKWKENGRIIHAEFEKLKTKFERKYGYFNINSASQVGKFLSDNNYNVQFKITIRGYETHADQRFSVSRDGFTESERKAAAKKLQEISGRFQYQRDKLWIEVEAKEVGDFQKVLGELGYNTIASPMTGKDALAFASEQCVVDYMEYKQVGEMLKKFFGEKFSQYFSTHKDGEYRIHANFLPVGARTTARFSCNAPNLQNIPARVVLYKNTKNEIDVSKMAREIFIPEKKHTLVKLDYSGQELRMAAVFADGDNGDYIRALYNQNPRLDEHMIVVKSTDLIKEHGEDKARKYAKTIRFGIDYGSGVNTIAVKNNWSYDTAKVLVDKIKTATVWAEETRQNLIWNLQKGKKKGIITILGRFIPLTSADKAYRYYNYRIQGSCADQLKQAMVLIDEWIKKNNLEDTVKFILTVHDEIVLSVDTKLLAEVLKVAKSKMENAIDSTVPFIVDPETGKNWAETIKDDSELFDEEEYEE